MVDLPEKQIFRVVQGLGRQLGVELPVFSEDVEDIERVLASLDALVERVSDRPLGLSIAPQIPLFALGEVGLAMRASEDLGAALERLVRFHRVRTPFVGLSLERRGEDALLQLEYHLPRRPCLPAIIEGGLALLVHMGRLVCGVKWAPDAVSFPHEVRHREAWEEFFQAPVSAASTAQLSICGEVLSLQTTTPDVVVASYLDASSEQKLESLAELPLSAQIQRWLAHRLEQAPTALEVARALGMSRRTFHRELRKAGTSYQHLLDGVRKNIAGKMLREGASVGEVALCLGYSDTSAFCRAYRRWTGRSPGGSKKAR